jgi:uncharacterized protein
MARSVVHYRNENGPFHTRHSLLEVNGFGPKTFEQSAGFLRIRDATNPLDSTAVHPERYHLVEMMAQGLSVPLGDLIGNPELCARLQLAEFKDQDRNIGLYTLEDIRSELEQPGRDPRRRFKAPVWSDDVQNIDDLKVGMSLEGRISNVTNFGAFVDIGIKRDGMVHISELSDGWVSDPRKVVQVGQVVKVKVKEIDLGWGRIALSMKTLNTDSRKPKKHKTKTKHEEKPKSKATLEDLAKKFNRS